MVSESHTHEILILHGTFLRSKFQRFYFIAIVLPAAKARRRRSLAPLSGSDDQIQQHQITEAETDDNRQKRGTDHGLMELLRMSSQSGKILEADQVFVSHPCIVILFPYFFSICNFQ